VAALHSTLEDAGFSVERVEAELGVRSLSGDPWEREAQRRRLGEKGSFAVLARLFLLEDAVDASLVEQAAGLLGVEGLVRLGLCRADGPLVRPTAKVVPHGEYFLASDLGDATSSANPFDYVPGVQAPSVTLAKLAVRHRVQSALDLGTGSGLQALLAARHCGRVVATDVNPRALRFAEFNRRLNRFDNIDLRLGWGFDPVPGERFDLIVSNPPYVISPDHSYAFRDSDIPGDELCRKIVQELPAHLNPGGFATVLVSWIHDPQGSWDAPLRDWVSGSQCDAWLLHYRTTDPLTHALGWLRPIARLEQREFEHALDRWLRHLHERGVEAIGHGAVVLRRRPGGSSWCQTAPLPLDQLTPASEHIRRVFAAGDVLQAAASDEQLLLGEHVRLTDHHQIRQTLVCRDGRMDVTGAELELTDGLRFTVGLDRYSALLLPHLDGSRPLHDALDATAAGLQLTPQGSQQFVPAALPAVKKLLALGFLEVARPPD
jgi:SAM-dependent methyltransferase